MCDSAEAMVRLKASLLRRRFAALTRTILFRLAGIFRSVGAVHRHKFKAVSNEGAPALDRQQRSLAYRITSRLIVPFMRAIYVPRCCLPNASSATSVDAGGGPASSRLHHLCNWGPGAESGPPDARLWTALPTSHIERPFGMRIDMSAAPAASSTLSRLAVY